MTPRNRDSGLGISDAPARIAVERSVVSTSRFPSKSSLDNIARHLRAIRATGKLVINFSQGGVNTVSFEARHQLNGSDHLELLFPPE